MPDHVELGYFREPVVDFLRNRRPSGSSCRRLTAPGSTPVLPGTLFSNICFMTAPSGPQRRNRSDLRFERFSVTDMIRTVVHIFVKQRAGRPAANPRASICRQNPRPVTGRSTVNSLKVGPPPILTPLIARIALSGNQPLTADERVFRKPSFPTGQVDHGPQGAERLVGAYIRRGLFPADVLFPRLEGEHKGLPAVPVNGLARRCGPASCARISFPRP